MIGFLLAFLLFAGLGAFVGYMGYMAGFKYGYERGHFVANRRYYKLHRFAKGLVTKLKGRKVPEAQWRAER